MNQHNNAKIYEEIDRIINCIYQDAPVDLKQHFHQFTNQIINNQNKTSPVKKDVQLQIATKVQNTHSQHSTKCFKNTLDQFMKGNTFEKKNEILETLLILSQLADKEMKQMLNFKKPPNGSLRIERSLKQRSSQLKQSQQQSFRWHRKQQSENLRFSLVKQLFFVFNNRHSEQIISTSEGYILKNAETGDSLREMVGNIADLGWLHHKIMAYQPKQGAIRKALWLAIRQQLKQFYIWNNTIQTLIKHNRISIRKLYVQSLHPLMILKWLAIVVEAVDPFDGCHIISIINYYRPSGLGVVDQLINRLVSYLLRSLLNYIKNWMYFGQLLDKRNQFFIKENKQVLPSQEWKLRFQLIYQNIPNILSLESARMVFNTGKSLYFLRNVCKVNYHLKTAFLQRQETQSMLQQGSSIITSQLFLKWLHSAYFEVSKVLIQTLFDRFNLKYHLMSMKHFYLAGKADFIQQLHYSLKDKLSQQNKNITERSLQTYISDAIYKCFHKQKTSNEETHSRNQRLLPFKINFEEAQSYQGWDFFNFKYSFSRLQPLQNIFSSQVINNYQRIFSFLWRIKQIKQILKELWLLQSREGALRIKRLNNKVIYQSSHHAYLLRNQMSHFIINLDSYIMVAIESSWNKFWSQIEQRNALDDIIKIHQDFQQSILQLVFHKQKHNIRAIINRIFGSIFSFKAVYLQLQQEFDEYQHRLNSYQQKMAKSKRSMKSQSFQMPQISFEKTFNRVKKARASFNQEIKQLYIEIGSQQNANLAVLKTKINFSWYYSDNFFIE